MTDLPLQAPVKHVLVNLAGSPDARCGGRRGSPAQAGLQCREAARARSVLERVLRTCSAGGAASLRPAVLRTVLHPLVPKVQRLLLGLCRRHGCQVRLHAANTPLIRPFTTGEFNSPPQFSRRRPKSAEDENGPLRP
eukprot:5153122-Pyramimonas_sp.AAC.1